MWLGTLRRMTVSSLLRSTDWRSGLAPGAGERELMGRGPAILRCGVEARSCALLGRGEDGLLQARTALRVEEDRLEEGPAAPALAERVAAALPPSRRSA